MCVWLVLLRSVEIYWAHFYLLYHSMSWRQPKGSDSSLQKTGLFFWRKYIEVLTYPRTLWWLSAHMISMEALCGTLRFFSFAVTFLQPDGVNRCQMSLRCVSVSRVTHAYTHSLSREESPVANTQTWGGHLYLNCCKFSYSPSSSFPFFVPSSVFQDVLL